jgi:hypothetical protein
MMMILYDYDNDILLRNGLLFRLLFCVALFIRLFFFRGLFFSISLLGFCDLVAMLLLPTYTYRGPLGPYLIPCTYTAASFICFNCNL